MPQIFYNEKNGARVLSKTKDSSRMKKPKDQMISYLWHWPSSAEPRLELIALPRTASSRIEEHGQMAGQVKHNSQGQKTRIESKLDCMQPNIDSGATPIGSASRAPDEIPYAKKGRLTWRPT